MCFKSKTALMGVLLLGSFFSFSMEQLQVESYTPPEVNVSYPGICSVYFNNSMVTQKTDETLFQDEIKTRDGFEKIKDCFELGGSMNFKSPCFLDLLKEHANIDVESEYRETLANFRSRVSCGCPKNAAEAALFNKKMNELGDKVYKWFNDTSDDAEVILRTHTPLRMFLGDLFFKARKTKTSFFQGCSVESQMPSYKQLWLDLGRVLRCRISSPFMRDGSFTIPILEYVCIGGRIIIDGRDPLLARFSRSQLESMIQKEPLKILENKELLLIFAGVRSYGDNSLFHLWAMLYPESIDQLIANYPKSMLAYDLNALNTEHRTPLCMLVPQDGYGRLIAKEVVIRAALAMINAGADITLCQEYILSKAAKHQPDLVEPFLQLGATPGPFVLAGAIKKRRFFVANALLRYDANPNDEHSLFRALDHFKRRKGKNAHFIALLLSHDADLFAKTSSNAWKGYSPMGYTHKLLRERVKKAYIPRDDDWHDLRYSVALMVDAARGNKPILDERLIDSYNLHENEEALYEQLKKTKRINPFEFNLEEYNWQGFTYLHKAIVEQDIEKVALLIGAGANPDLKNAFGLTAHQMNDQILQAFSAESYWGKKALIIADILNGKEPKIEEPEKPESIKQDMQFILKEIQRLVCEHKWGRLSFFASLVPSIFCE